MSGIWQAIRTLDATRLINMFVGCAKCRGGVLMTSSQLRVPLLLKIPRIPDDVICVIDGIQAYQGYNQ